MVKRHSYSFQDKLKRDHTIRRNNQLRTSLVPWKELASKASIKSNNKSGDRDYFEFLEDFPESDRRTTEKAPNEANESNGFEEVSLSQEFPQIKKNHSRDVSPMQEKFLLEQKWQENLIKADEFLSNACAHYKGEFNEKIFVETFKNENFLNILFKLFDSSAKGSVPQDKIINSARETIQGSESREWTDLLDVVAYIICNEEDVTEDCFKKIFRSKKVAEKLFKTLIKEEESKTILRNQIMDLIANLTYAQPRQGFSAENVERIESLFRQNIGDREELTFQDFKKIIQSKNTFFVERVFNIFDRDRSGSVSLSEFVDAMHQFAGKSTDDKFKFLFKIYDLDGDGLIQHEELEQVMKACMEENGMTFSDEQIEDLTLALFEEADTEHRGEITYESLKAQLEKHAGLLENLTISIDRWLVPVSDTKQKSFGEKLSDAWPYQLTLPYVRNNYVYLIFLFVFVGVNIGMFIKRAFLIKSQGGNIYYILARASGHCLNFNCTFILVFMLRLHITFLRSKGFSRFLPLDHHIYFHKLCGWVILFHSLLHTVMHLINFPTVVIYSDELNPEEYSAVEWIFTSKPGVFGLIPGWANPTGVILIIILIIMVVCSLPFVRKSGYFEVFYWTHLFYIVFWTLTILHGPHFWKWFLGPAVLFILEKLYLWFHLRSGHGKAYISSGTLLPSKVTHLVIRKPTGFHFSCGDYVFVNIPAIAKYEWHPFTISSAPEHEGVLWLHVRAVGQWTARLYEYFESQNTLCEKERAYVDRKRSNLSITLSKMDTVLVNVDENNLKSSYESSSNGNKISQDGVAPSSRKNGMTNVAFESETKHIRFESNEDQRHDEKFEAQMDSQLNVNKNSVEKTQSAPPLDSQIHSSDLIADEMEDEFEMVGDKKLRKIMFNTNKSVARSLRYMRRKPRVVTLDIPTRQEENGTNENDDDSGKILNDVEAPLPTTVTRTGRKLLKKLSGLGHEEHVQNLQEETTKVKRMSRLREAQVLGECSVGEPLVIYLNGPYGTPSSHIFRAQHAVLIGTGIGVTPYASILQSIMERYLKARQICPNCDYSWTSSIPETVMNLKKVDFFWINRNQRSFEWFVNLLSQLEIEQAEKGGALDRFLDMHMYITSALQKTDMKAVGLQLALDLLHEKGKRDLITGLKTRTNAGRPNWDKVFKQLSNQNKGKITVFFCGPPALARTLRFKCHKFGFKFKKEVF